MKFLVYAMPESGQPLHHVSGVHDGAQSGTISLFLSVPLSQSLSFSVSLSLSLSLFLLEILCLCQLSLPSHQPAAVRLSLLAVSKEPATLHFNDCVDKANEAALWVSLYLEMN